MKGTKQSMKVEFKLDALLPKLGGTDELRVQVDISSHPQLIYLMRGFQRFLVMIGVDPGIVATLYNPEIEIDQTPLSSLSSGDEENMSEEEFLAQQESDSMPQNEEEILSKVQDSTSLKNFKKAVQKNDEFAQRVFYLFLEEMYSE